MKRLLSAAVILCLLLSGCSFQPTKVIYVMTATEAGFEGGTNTRTEYVYDQEGYLRQEVTFYGAEEMSRLTVAQWDDYGNPLVFVEDERFGVYSYQCREYDEQGNLLYIGTSYGGEIVSYDAAYSYDENGNMLTMCVMDSSGVTSTAGTVFRYTYQQGRRVRTERFGLLRQMDVDIRNLPEDFFASQTPATVTEHFYDFRGRLVKDVISIGKTTSETLYEYHTDPITGNTAMTAHSQSGTITVTVTDSNGNVIRQETDTGRSVQITTYTYAALQVPASWGRKQ